MRGSAEAATRRRTGRRRVTAGRRAAARCVKSGRGWRGRRATEVRRACAVTRRCVRGRRGGARCVRAGALRRRDRGGRCRRSVGCAGGRCARGGRKGETSRRRDADHRPFECLFLRRTCGWSCRTGRRRRGGRCNRCGWRCRRRLRLSRLVHHEHRPLELRGCSSSNVESALRTGGGRFRVFRTAVRTEQGVPPGAGVRTPLATPTDAPLHATRKAASFSSFACLGRLLDALRLAGPGHQRAKCVALLMLLVRSCLPAHRRAARAARRGSPRTPSGRDVRVDRARGDPCFLLRCEQAKIAERSRRITTLTPRPSAH